MLPIDREMGKLYKSEATQTVAGLETIDRFGAKQLIIELFVFLWLFHLSMPYGKLNFDTLLGIFSIHNLFPPTQNSPYCRATAPSNQLVLVIHKNEEAIDAGFIIQAHRDQIQIL